MGFFNLIYYGLFATTVTFLALNHIPYLLDIEPQPYTTKILKAEGPLAVNKDLDKGEFILKDQVLGAECLELYKGEIYASLANGKIVTLTDNKVTRTIADTSGRPLGLRFYKDELYVADARKGLLKVDVKTGNVMVLWSTTEKIDGHNVYFPDDLDIHDGVIYFSDLSKKWKLENWPFGIIEHENSGRVYRYDLTTGKADVLLDGLYYPNGIQISEDKKSLLVAEIMRNRILRHHLSGPKKGQTEVFVELPGEPDNLRLSPRGTYWIALMSSRDSPSWSDRLGPYPKIRKALVRLSDVTATALNWINQYISSPVVQSITTEVGLTAVMGFFNLIYYGLFATTVMFLMLNHAPNLLDIEPKPYTTKILKAEGALAVNKDLDKGEFILEDQVLAAECLEVYKGEIYASLANGKIVTITDTKVTRTVADTSGRPLGLRFYKDELYVADAKKGLLKVDVKTGKVKVLVSTTEKIDGHYVSFADDLDILDGVIYFSDMSKKWKSGSVALGLIEHENSGRVYKYDLTTGKTEVLLDELYYPNGIQLSEDKKSILIAEFIKLRILRHHLSGPKKGQTEVFVELPGEPDNLRLSPRGTYWIALMSFRDSPNWTDRLGPYPKIRKALARLSDLTANCLNWINQYISSPVVETITTQLKSGMHFMLLHEIGHSAIIEVDLDGKIVRSLQSTNPKLALMSHALEHKEHLYLGSFIHPYIVKLKL